MRCPPARGTPVEPMKRSEPLFATRGSRASGGTCSSRLCLLSGNSVREAVNAFDTLAFCCHRDHGQSEA